MLAVEALFEEELVDAQPSLVAAALLYSERRARGAVPFWPSTLARMTGYEDLSAQADMADVVRAAQKYARKPLYAQLYKEQTISLALDAVAAPATGPVGPSVLPGAQGALGTTLLPVALSADEPGPMDLANLLAGAPDAMPGSADSALATLQPQGEPSAAIMELLTGEGDVGLSVSSLLGAPEAPSMGPLTLGLTPCAQLASHTSWGATDAAALGAAFSGIL